MRWLFIFAVVCALVAPALAGDWRVDRVSTSESIDPATGNKVITTTTVRSRAEADAFRWSAPYLASPVVVGAPVVTDSRMFPASPVDGQEVWINGVKYEYDADDGTWEVDD